MSKSTSTISTKSSVEVTASDFAAGDITITPPENLDLCTAAGVAEYLNSSLVAVEYNAAQYAGGTFSGDVAVSIDISDLEHAEYAGNYTITTTGEGTARVAKSTAAHTGKATCVETNQSVAIVLTIDSSGTASVSSADQALVNSYSLSSHTLAYSLKVSIGPKAATAVGQSGTETDESAQDGVVKVTVSNA